MNDEQSLLTIRQAAKLMGVSVSTLRRWCRAGHIESFRINSRGDRRFLHHHLEAVQRPRSSGRPRKDSSAR